MSARGLTTLELLLALSITVITGGAIAAVTTGVARGIGDMNTSRSALQRAHAAHVRLRAYFDPGLCALDWDAAEGLAFWLHDDGATPGSVNLTELRVFWFDAGTGEISVERASFPDEWDEVQVEAADLTYGPVDDLFVAMRAARALGQTETTILADGVSGFGLSHSETTVRRAQRVRLSVSVDLGHGVEPILMAFGMPNHREPA